MSSLDPAQHAVRVPTRTKLVTEGSQKAVYPSVAPSLSFDPPSPIRSHFARTLTEHRICIT